VSEHLYVLFEQPAALSGAQWGTVLEQLVRVLDKRGASSMPARRVHYARSRDGSKVLLEGVFDLRDLDAEDLTRLCKYVSAALGGEYAPEEVREELRGRVTVFEGDNWRQRGDAAREAKAAAREVWEDQP